MKVNRLLVPLIVVVCLLGSVGAGLIFGWWQVTAQPLRAIDGSDTSNIRGSSSLEEVSLAFGITQQDLYALLELPADTPFSTQLKELEDIIEVSEVRARVDAFLAQPTAAPGTGAATLAPTATLPPTAVPAASPTAKRCSATSEAASEHAEPSCEIKGSMSLQQVADGCGVTLEALYAGLGLPGETPATALLRELAASVEGFEVSTVKTVVADLQAQ